MNSATEPEAVQNSAPVFKWLSLDQIRHSPTNPRRRFDEAALAELAESIKAKGVLQPVLVRPIEDGDIRYELVAGERRYRASQIAGIPVIPAVIREISEREAAELQIIENLHREDLTALEEAQGFKTLLEQHDYTTEQLAEKLGKSKSYVYGRVKLCQLPELARTALDDGRITASTAGLIARIPNAELRVEATQEIISPNINMWKKGDEALTYQEAKDLIEEHYMLELKKAPFSRKAAIAVPRGDGPLGPLPDIIIGACDKCPKMTGNNREEFPDGRADICTDPACYAEKVKGHNAQALAKAHEQGLKVWSDKETKKAFPHGRIYSHEGWIDLAEQCYQDSKRRSYKQLLGDQVQPEVVQLDDGRVHHIVKETDARKILKAQGIGNRDADRDRGYKEDQAKARKESVIRQRVAGLITEKAVQAVEREGLDLKALRLVTENTVHHCWHDALKKIQTRRALPKETEHGPGPSILKIIPTMTQEQLWGMLAEIAVTRDLFQWSTAYGGGKMEPRVINLCQAYEIDPAAIEAETREAVKAKEAKKARPKGPGWGAALSGKKK
jgi:ParB/RepB/Spo0J family partition protein